MRYPRLNDRSYEKTCLTGPIITHPTGTSRMSCTLSTMSLRRVGDVPVQDEASHWSARKRTAL